MIQTLAEAEATYVPVTYSLGLERVRRRALEDFFEGLKQISFTSQLPGTLTVFTERDDSFIYVARESGVDNEEVIPITRITARIPQSFLSHIAVDVRDPTQAIELEVITASGSRTLSLFASQAAPLSAALESARRHHGPSSLFLRRVGY